MPAKIGALAQIVLLYYCKIHFTSILRNFELFELDIFPQIQLRNIHKGRPISFEFFVPTLFTKLVRSEKCLRPLWMVPYC